MKNYYFLFGEQAVDQYENGGIPSVKEGEVFKYTEGESPISLLNAADGWYRYAEITEQDYLTFKQKQDERN